MAMQTLHLVIRELLIVHYVYTNIKINFVDNLNFHTKYKTSVVNRNGQDYLNLKKIISDFDTTR